MLSTLSELLTFFATFGLVALAGLGLILLEEDDR